MLGGEESLTGFFCSCWPCQHARGDARGDQQDDTNETGQPGHDHGPQRICHKVCNRSRDRPAGRCAREANRRPLVRWIESAFGDRGMSRMKGISHWQRSGETAEPEPGRKAALGRGPGGFSPFPAAIRVVGQLHDACSFACRRARAEAGSAREGGRSPRARLTTLRRRVRFLNRLGGKLRST